MASAKSYKISGNVVLDATTVGTGVTSSSLTSVGTLTSLAVAGDLTVDTNTLKVDSTNNRVGVVNASPAYPLDVAGDVNTSTKYKVGGTDVLTSTTLGSGVTSSSLTTVGTLTSLTVSGDVSGAKYKIGGQDVLTATALGDGVLASKLTSVGTLSNLTVAGGLTVDTSTLKVDSANNRVGVVNASPAYPLDVTGDCNLSAGSNYRIGGVALSIPTASTYYTRTHSVSQTATYTGITLSFDTLTSEGGSGITYSNQTFINSNAYTVYVIGHCKFTWAPPGGGTNLYFKTRLGSGSAFNANSEVVYGNNSTSTVQFAYCAVLESNAGFKIQTATSNGTTGTITNLQNHIKVDR